MMRQTMRELLRGSGDEFDLVTLVSTYPIAVICGSRSMRRR